MHRRPHLTGRDPRRAGAAHRAAAAGGLLLLGLTACSGAVPTTIPAGAGDPACARVVRAAPSHLLTQGRRDTSPTSAAVTAWGDPAIVLRCGVTPPGPTTDLCTTVDGVDWVAQPVKDGYVFTTYGRTPAVQVSVPERYAPETFALTGLAQAVALVPQGEHRCS